MDSLRQPPFPSLGLGVCVYTARGGCKIRESGSRLGVSSEPSRPGGRSGTTWGSRLPSGEARAAKEAVGRAVGARGAAARVRRAKVGLGACRRDPGREPRAKGEDARALPEMGSEVLGTECGTRPHARPLSNASSNSRNKGEVPEGRRRGRSRATAAGIFATSWPPGCGAPRSFARQLNSHQPGPTRFPSVRLGLRLPVTKQPGSTPSRRDQ